jgi:hypothetical protein
MMSEEALDGSTATSLITALTDAIVSVYGTGRDRKPLSS